MAKIVVNMSAGRIFQIAMQIIPIHRMCTIINDGAGALKRGKTTQIGDPLFGDDHFDAVFAVINMAAHWHDG